MRNLVLVLTTIFALCLFTAFAVAQTPGGTTGVNANSSQNSSTPSAAGSSAAVSGSQTDPNSVNAGSGSEKTVDGCIVKEQSDYFIQPKDGDRERLAGAQDFSSHVGHEVKVRGTEQAATASNSATAGSTGSMASSSDRTATSGSASTESQNNAAGSMAGNAGSSNATGTGAASSNSNWSGKDFMVTKVDMVSASCPADIQKKIDAGKK